jgi:hypothetical protein
MDGASFSPHLLEDRKWDCHCHLDAPYYWLCPVTQLEEAGYRKKWPVTGKSLVAPMAPLFPVTGLLSPVM